jgi:chromosome segregation ATPase
LINSDKDDRLACALGKLTELDIQIDDLEMRRDQAMHKLAIYQDLIRQAKADQGRHDSVLMGQLRQLEAEAAGIEKDLQEIDTRVGELKRKRTEIRRYVDEVSAALHKYTPAQIDTTIAALDDQNEKARGLIQKAKHIEEDLDTRILDLQLLIQESADARDLKRTADDLIK